MPVEGINHFTFLFEKFHVCNRRVVITPLSAVSRLLKDSRNVNFPSFSNIIRITYWFGTTNHDVSRGIKKKCMKKVDEKKTRETRSFESFNIHAKLFPTEAIPFGEKSVIKIRLVQIDTYQLTRHRIHISSVIVTFPPFTLFTLFHDAIVAFIDFFFLYIALLLFPWFYRHFFFTYNLWYSASLIFLFFVFTCRWYIRIHLVIV